MRTLMFLGLLVSLLGCASTRHIHLPDGTTGTMVSCSGAERDWGDCMNRAHALCGGRYDIVERYDERTGGAVQPGDAGARTWSASVDRKMLVRCAD